MTFKTFFKSSKSKI